MTPQIPITHSCFLFILIFIRICFSHYDLPPPFNPLSHPSATAAGFFSVLDFDLFSDVI